MSKYRQGNEKESHVIFYLFIHSFLHLIIIMIEQVPIKAMERTALSSLR